MAMTEEEQLNGVSMDELPKSSIAQMKAKDAQIPVSVAGEGSYNVPVRDVLTTAELAATAVTDTALIAHRAESDPHPQYVLGTEIGQTVAPLVGGAIPSQYLPGSYNEVQYFDDIADLPVTGSDDVIYVTRNDGLIYRWGGEGYHRLNGALALGETPETAYRGDRGKTAYDHALSQGNPHGTTAADLGLGTVLPRLDALYHGQAPIQSAWRPFPMQQNDFKAMELFSFARSADEQETIEFGLDIWTKPPPSGSLTYNYLYLTRCVLIRTGGDSPGGSGYSQWKPVSNGAPIWQDTGNVRVEIYATATHCRVYLVHHGAWEYPNAIIRITDLSITGNSTVELSTASIQDLTPLFQLYGLPAVTIGMTSDKGIFSTLEDWPAVDEELYTNTRSLHSLLQQVRSSLKWVRALLKSHSDRHVYGGSDPVSVDTRQISNMTDFGRSLVDDASPAAARSTLGAAADTVTLSDSAASSSLPTAGTSTLLADVLQQVRNFLRWLDANKAASSHAHGSVTTDGKIGSTAGLPVTTGTGGALQAAAWSTALPTANGAASVGSSTVPSRSDHVHPTDTSRAAADHAAQHAYGGTYPVSVDTRQISNMTDFARTLVDDATAAEARTTLGAAAAASLTDGSVTKVGTASVGSTSQPMYLNAGVPTPITGLIGNSTSGNAATATKLATARTFNFSGDASGTGSFDGSANVAITITIADNSHAHSISTLSGVANKTYYNDDGTGNVQISSGAITRNIELRNGTVTALYTSFDEIPITNVNHPALSAQTNEVVTSARFAAFVRPLTFGAVISANQSGYVPVHGQQRSISIDGCRINLAVTPEEGTISWLRYVPVGTTGTFSLEYTDDGGSYRFIAKSITKSNNTTALIIKLIRTGSGWRPEWIYE